MDILLFSFPFLNKCQTYSCSYYFSILLVVNKCTIIQFMKALQLGVNEPSFVRLVVQPL